MKYKKKKLSLYRSQMTEPLKFVLILLYCINFIYYVLCTIYLQRYSITLFDQKANHKLLKNFITNCNCVIWFHHFGPLLVQTWHPCAIFRPTFGPGLPSLWIFVCLFHACALMQNRKIAIYSSSKISRILEKVIQCIIYIWLDR